MKQIYEFELYPECVENKLVESEDRSRGFSHRIDKVKETSNGTWEKCKKFLETLFKDKLGIEDNIIIEEAYRTKSSPESRRRSKQRTMLCKFHYYKDKVKSWKMQIN